MDTYSILAYPAKELPSQYTAMVFSKWLRSLRFGNPVFKAINSDDFYKDYHAYLENLLKKPDSIVRLAVLSDDLDVVLGFSVSREDVLDYIHVHKDQRKMGIAKLLMPTGVTTMTHLTKTAMEIWQTNSKYKHLKFNPFA